MTLQRKILWGVLSTALFLVALLFWSRNAAAPAATGSSGAMAADPSSESSSRDSVAKSAAPGGAHLAQSSAATVDAGEAPGAALQPSTASPAGTPAMISATPTEAQQVSAEGIAATARMYAAHASLRTPEVADPDSAANRQILSTMVVKALAQPATPPPAASNTR